MDKPLEAAQQQAAMDPELLPLRKSFYRRTATPLAAASCVRGGGAYRQPRERDLPLPGDVARTVMLRNMGMGFYGASHE
jgi:hypothetical protein